MTNNSVFLSILSMDSYNRGGAGLKLVTPVGNVALGNATWVGDPGVNATTGFFATRYSWNGKNVISFRGTDFPSNFTDANQLAAFFNDIGNGWVNGAGGTGGQLADAITFYNTVTAGTLTSGATNAILVGHSLGGGLAGFIGYTTGTEAHVVDNMSFAAAVASWHAFNRVSLPTGNSVKSFYVDDEVVEFVRAIDPFYTLAAYYSLQTLQVVASLPAQVALYLSVAVGAIAARSTREISVLWRDAGSAASVFPMNRRSLVCAVVASAFSPLVSGCNPFDSSNIDLRYRMKVQIFAGGRIREGSGVMRSLLSDGAGRAWAEAIPIDMGGGEYVFAILGGLGGILAQHRFWPQEISTFQSLFPPPPAGVQPFKAWLNEKPFPDEREAYKLCRPQLVRYQDLLDPTTAQFIEWPGEAYKLGHSSWARSLVDAYGSGARIERVTLELVAQPVTRRIQKLLPWVGDLPGADPNVSFSYVNGPPDKLRSYILYSNFCMDGYYSS